MVLLLNKWDVITSLSTQVLLAYVSCRPQCHSVPKKVLEFYQPCDLKKIPNLLHLLS